MIFKVSFFGKEPIATGNVTAITAPFNDVVEALKFYGQHRTLDMLYADAVELRDDKNPIPYWAELEDLQGPESVCNKVEIFVRERDGGNDKLYVIVGGQNNMEIAARAARWVKEKFGIEDHDIAGYDFRS